MRVAVLSALAATAAAQAASDFNGYINYTTVTGYFLQDLASTNVTGFDYTAVNFGLINQTYSGVSTSAGLTQWEQFEELVNSLNTNSPYDTVYKVFWFGRHGEGYHNAAETFYGTPAWNCYWSELNGNATVTWADADLTANGINQALIANAFWKSEIANQKIPFPQSYYTSPLTRCLRTANLTFSDIPTPEYYPFVPEVKEFFREGISTHTCDRRSNKTYIHNRFPTYTFEAGFSETDLLWNANYAETSSAQDIRSKSALDSVFKDDDHTWISVTSHSGEIASLLRVLGHRTFSLSTGAIIPVLVKAQFLPAASAPVISSAPARTSSGYCTNGPPITSISTLAQGCVCSGAASTGGASSSVRASSATGSVPSSRLASSTVTISRTSTTSIIGTVTSKPLGSGVSSSTTRSKTCKRSTKSKGISASTTGKTAGTSTRAKTCKRSSTGLTGSGASSKVSSSMTASGSASRSASIVSSLSTVTLSTSSSKATVTSPSTSASSKSTSASSSTSSSKSSASSTSSSKTSSTSISGTNSKTAVTSSSSTSSSIAFVASTSSTSGKTSVTSTSSSHVTAMSESLSLSTSTKTKACKSKSTAHSFPPYIPEYGHGGDEHEHEHGWKWPQGHE